MFIIFNKVESARCNKILSEYQDITKLATLTQLSLIFGF